MGTVARKKRNLTNDEFISNFFTEQFKIKEPTYSEGTKLDMESVVASLLSSTPGEPSKEILEKCSQLLAQQRTLEDTRARRRLEKWATRVISWYLIVVCALILLNGGSFIFFFAGFITDQIMAVILSTTTVNIIGLGLIVLKGHFRIQKNK